jgi:hypothetical protein
MLFVESGGDNLAANYSRELADYVSRVVSSCVAMQFLGQHVLTSLVLPHVTLDHLRDVSFIPPQPKLVV